MILRHTYAVIGARYIADTSHVRAVDEVKNTIADETIQPLTYIYVYHQWIYI